MEYSIVTHPGKSLEEAFQKSLWKRERCVVRVGSAYLHVSYTLSGYPILDVTPGDGNEDTLRDVRDFFLGRVSYRFTPGERRVYLVAQEHDTAFKWAILGNICRRTY